MDKGGRGSKNPNFLRMSLMEAPLREGGKRGPKVKFCHNITVERTLENKAEQNGITSRLTRGERESFAKELSLRAPV